jgi:hypothetical protein
VAAIALTGEDSPVFFTRGFWTTISFVSKGREDARVLTAGAVGEVSATGGRFVGRLDVVFTTRPRAWAEAESARPTANNKIHTEKPAIFLELIKTKTPFFGFGAANLRCCLWVNNAENLKEQQIPARSD